MKRICILILALLAVLPACKRVIFTPRPTIPLVLSVAADTLGAGRVAAHAGHHGSQGAIAIIGEPVDGMLLAHRFQTEDNMDNVDGRALRDSLPDFAGETFDVILDAVSAPYSHFLSEQENAIGKSSLDSLREAAVINALFAWDSLGLAKVLIFTSPLQAVYGLFDVDTLQQLTGGRSHLISPVKTMLADAAASGARELAVWASRDVRSSKVYETVFNEMGTEGNLSVITPEQALDARTRFRSLLRQYRSTGRKLDALLLDGFAQDPAPLLSELAMIRQCGTEEDMAFCRMLSPSFVVIDPLTSVVSATYKLLRRDNLFTHRIHRPMVRYFETVESASGEITHEEVHAHYAQQAYVQDFD